MAPFSNISCMQDLFEGIWHDRPAGVDRRFFCETKNRAFSLEVIGWAKGFEISRCFLERRHDNLMTQLLHALANLVHVVLYFFVFIYFFYHVLLCQNRQRHDVVAFSLQGRVGAYICCSPAVVLTTNHITPSESRPLMYLSKLEPKESEKNWI